MRLEEKEQEHLNSVLEMLNRAKKTLARTYSICKTIGIKEVYSEDEVDRFEALMSRFARTTYIIIDKGYRLIIDFGPDKSLDKMIESIQRAEKNSLLYPQTS